MKKNLRTVLRVSVPLMAATAVVVVASEGSAKPVGPKERCAGRAATITSSAAVITGTEGNDVIYVKGPGVHVVNALGGDDWVCGGVGADEINGGAGRDRLFGAQGADTLRGDAGADIIFGGNGKDVIFGGADGDHLFGNNDNDTIYGEAGDDLLEGGNGGDTMEGGEGSDIIFGGAGRDRITDVLGDNTLFTDGPDENNAE